MVTLSTAPFGRGTHGVEAQQRTGRHHDARTGLLRAAHQMHARQQGTDRGRHEYAACLDRSRGDCLEHRGRRCLDDDVGLGQALQRDHRAAVRGSHCRSASAFA